MQLQAKRFAKNRKSPDQKRAELRESIWPGSQEWGWDRHGHDGFVTIPRLLPWILHLLKYLAGERGVADPSPAYVELWCRSFDQGLVTIKDDEECAFAAGYSSNRAHRTWSEQMTTLVDLGFILASREGLREFGQILLLNPLAVAAGLNKSGKLPDGWWASFSSRAQDIGATIPKPLVLPNGLAKMK